MSWSVSMTSDEKPTERGSMFKHTDEEVLTQRGQPKTTIDTVRAFKTKLTNAEGDIQQTSFKAEEVHDQRDHMYVKILAKERPSNMATPAGGCGQRKTVIPRMENLAVVDACVCNDSKTDVLKSSNEEGNWSDMSEDSSQKGDAVLHDVLTSVRGTDATCIPGPGAQHRVRVLRE